MPPPKSSVLITNPAASLAIRQATNPDITPKPGRVRPGAEFEGDSVHVTSKSKPVHKNDPKEVRRAR